MVGQDERETGHVHGIRVVFEPCLLQQIRPFQHALGQCSGSFSPCDAVVRQLGFEVPATCQGFLMSLEIVFTGLGAAAAPTGLQRDIQFL